MSRCPSFSEKVWKLLWEHARFAAASLPRGRQPAPCAGRLFRLGLIILLRMAFQPAGSVAIALRFPRTNRRRVGESMHRSIDLRTTRCQGRCMPLRPSRHRVRCMPLRPSRHRVRCMLPRPSRRRVCCMPPRRMSRPTQIQQRCMRLQRIRHRERCMRLRARMIDPRTIRWTLMPSRLCRLLPRKTNPTATAC